MDSKSEAKRFKSNAKHRGEPFIMIPKGFLDSETSRTVSDAALKLYLLFLAQYKGADHRKVRLPYRDVRVAFGWTWGKFKKARTELADIGLVTILPPEGISQTIPEAVRYEFMDVFAWRRADTAIKDGTVKVRHDGRKRKRTRDEQGRFLKTESCSISQGQYCSISQGQGNGNTFHISRAAKCEKR